jgi:23S rRNA (uracil1939-C5)-methyltransferase
MKNKKSLPVIEGVEITGVAAEGNAIAKYGDRIVFVPYVVPGDVVDIQLTRKKSSFAEGRAVRFVKYSEEREDAFCEHYGICGGCKWQALPYPAQLRYKQQQVVDSLQRIGKVESFEMLPISGSEDTVYYRNKLEYTFSNKSWLTEAEVKSGEVAENRNALGFHIPKKFDKVLDIRKCWLQDDVSNRIRNEIKIFAVENNYEFFDLRNQCGLLRNIIIRTSSTTGEVMLIVVFYYDDAEKRETLLTHIAGKFPSISSLFYIINGKANDSITDLDAIIFKGKDYIVENMGNLTFRIGPKSFFQTNTLQARRLYSVVEDFAALTGKETVYDLYTGTGTIANFIARQAKKVIGIEYVPEAIEDARINSEINGIANTKFFAGDMKNILNSEFITINGKPDVIITDPPRAGMHDDVTRAILQAEPAKIIYVSCNPATQARDINLLSSKYHVVKVQPVDMFPHTHHVENVALLETV